MYRFLRPGETASLKSRNVLSPDNYESTHIPSVRRVMRAQKARQEGKEGRRGPESRPVCPVVDEMADCVLGALLAGGKSKGRRV